MHVSVLISVDQDDTLTRSKVSFFIWLMTVLVFFECVDLRNG